MKSVMARRIWGISKNKREKRSDPLDERGGRGCPEAVCFQAR